MVAGRPSSIGAKSRRIAHYEATKDAASKGVRPEVETKVNDWLTQNPTVNDGVVNADELKALVIHVAGRSTSDDIVNTALRRQEFELGRVPYSKVAQVCSKIYTYMQEQAVIDPMFAKYDCDKSGALDRKELAPLLKAVAARENYTNVTDEDIDHVVTLCDTDGNDVIDKDEVLMMCAQFKHLTSQEKLPSQRQAKPSSTSSSACSIL